MLSSSGSGYAPSGEGVGAGVVACAARSVDLDGDVEFEVWIVFVVRVGSSTDVDSGGDIDNELAGVISSDNTCGGSVSLTSRLGNDKCAIRWGKRK